MPKQPLPLKKTKHYAQFGFFDPNMDINLKVIKTIAIAASIANSIGFLANFFLYGINFPTAFCGGCAILCLLNYFIGTRTKYYLLLGSILVDILCFLEFPLLVFSYGPVMYPYMVLGFISVVMLCTGKQRLAVCIGLGIYDVAVIVVSTFKSFIFGSYESTELLGSAVITFAVSIITLAICVVTWQKVYVHQTRDIDPVTKCLTYHGFTKAASGILKNAKENEFAVLFFNIVGFKAINSLYSIEGGNGVLKQLAERLTKSSSLSPILVCRQNADHFFLLVEQKEKDYSHLTDICRFKYIFRNMELPVQLNCGVYPIVDSSVTVQDACDRASSVINYSKLMRTQHYAIYDEKMEDQFKKETQVLALAEEAIEKKEFRPYYQPVVDCKTGKIASAEALARWISTDGVIPPGVFIPVLEKKELISDLDSIISHKVYDFMEERVASGKKVVPISVNLSRVDLYDEKFMRELQIMVNGAGMHAFNYRLEVTESSYEAIPENVIHRISDLRSLGVQILIDDFGSGYSSLGMITDYQFDIIKLDMSFARKLESSDKDKGVIKSLIELSHNLGAKVVAEGVETEAQYLFLKENGCDYIQGYYFYKPLSEEEFVKLLDEE